MISLSRFGLLVIVFYGSKQRVYSELVFWATYVVQNKISELHFSISLSLVNRRYFVLIMEPLLLRHRVRRFQEYMRVFYREYRDHSALTLVLFLKKCLPIYRSFENKSLGLYIRSSLTYILKRASPFVHLLA